MKLKIDASRVSEASKVSKVGGVPWILIPYGERDARPRQKYPRRAEREREFLRTGDEGAPEHCD